MKHTLSLLALVAGLGLATQASAGFIIEPRSGGKGFANYAPGPNMVAASTSTATSAAFGVTPMIGSIFGGDAPSGTMTPTPDSYLFKYTPGTDADNLVIPAGTALNNDGSFGTGAVGGASGLYRVYTTWPTTTNVDARNTPTNYSLSDGVSTLLTTSVNQNDVPVGTKGNEWFLLGEVNLVAGTTYTVNQTNTQEVINDPLGGTNTYTNYFTSMRSSGVLFERVPEPATALLAVLGLAAAGLRRR